MTPEEYRAHVVAVVDKAPPLSAEQCAVLTRIMLPPGWSFVPVTAEVADAA